MPENLTGIAWNNVDNATGVVLNVAGCSVAVCGRNGEWRAMGIPANSTYIQTPFDVGYWGQYYTNGVWKIGSGGIIQPGSSQISMLNKNNLVFQRNLSFGSTGNDVKQLQALLVNEVSYPVDLLTGYFGAITQNAVKKLQEKYGVKPVSGYFGEITRRTLKALISD